ncbi:hypothetical protein [Acidovorax sp. sic0104]|uniref:hypothetical protein n=1 Tax=Acidovorax sp. sic0104 TaxID=2854784 RepID=UPI001C45C439|nr:hypothetical protein [Acidovorax sp. sic0104]MBV7540979.1 hypothetical protein [Acidovorax sp. sic0104]
MRRGFYFVLMMVLVLRGLMGSAMATGMAMPAPLQPGHEAAVHSHTASGHGLAPANAMRSASGAAPAEQEFSPAIVDVPASSHDHDHGSDHDHDHGQALQDGTHVMACHGASDSTGACGGHSHHTGACSACGICHSAMLEAPGVVTPAPHPQRTALPRAFSQFDSAPAARAIKPPIA